jgi:hypothetical protein
VEHCILNQVDRQGCVFHIPTRPWICQQRRLARHLRRTVNGYDSLNDVNGDLADVYGNPLDYNGRPIDGCGSPIYRGNMHSRVSNMHCRSGIADSRRRNEGRHLSWRGFRRGMLGRRCWNLDPHRGRRRNRTGKTVSRHQPIGCGVDRLVNRRANR